MRKILIASHGRFASGIKTSLELFVGQDFCIETIDAYVEGEEEDYEKKINGFLSSLTEEDEGVIFSDILGGSVNQKIVAASAELSKQPLFIITNMNLPIMISILLYPEQLTEKEIERMITESTVALVHIEGEKFENMSVEDFF